MAWWSGWQEFSETRTCTSRCSAIRNARRSGGIQAALGELRVCSGQPVAATNGVRYATAYEREVLDLLTAVRHHTDRGGHHCGEHQVRSRCMDFLSRTAELLTDRVSSAYLEGEAPAGVHVRDFEQSADGALHAGGSAG